MTLLDQVKAYASAHYNDGGWDVIVECWEDDELLDAIGEATTLEEAIGQDSLLGSVVSVWADREADAQNSAF